MTQEADIRKAARHMISRYGDSALQEIELRIAELGERGETDAMKMWIEIKQAVQANIRKDSQGLN